MISTIHMIRMCVWVWALFSCLPHWWRTNIDLIYIDHSVWKTSQGRPGYDLTFPLCQQNILIWLCLSRSRINADTWSLWNTLSFPLDFVFIHCTWTSLTVAIIIIWPIQYKQKHLTRLYPLNSKIEKKYGNFNNNHKTHYILLM